MRSSVRAAVRRLDLLAKAVGQATSMVNVRPSSRASSLPQLIGVVHSSCVRRRFPVGAGLLAKAVGQATSMVNVRTSSRASPLPQLIGVVHSNCVRRRFPVGASLLAKAVGQATSMVNVRPSSRASPLPQVRRQAEGFFGGWGLASKVCGGATCRVVIEPWADSEYVTLEINMSSSNPSTGSLTRTRVL